MNNIQTRTVSGAVFVAIIVGAVLFSQFGTLVILTLLLSFLGLREFNGLIKAKYGVNVPLVESVIGAILMTALCQSVGMSYFSTFVLVAYILFVFVVLALELWRKQENPVMTWGMFVLGQTYIAIPFALLNTTLNFSGSKAVVLAVFVMVWVNDTFAYLTGMLSGKSKKGNHKMFPRVSPKKSWEGLAGGAVFAVLASVVFYYVAETKLTLPMWIGLSIVIVVFGTIGDLVESLLKRTLGIKDSGTLIPGHGGLLDRMDSVLFASVGAFVYVFYVVMVGLYGC